MVVFIGGIHISQSKRFKSQSGQFHVTWYFKKRLTLLFEGALGEELAIRLKEMLNASRDNVAESALVVKGKDGVSELEAEVPTSMHAENVSQTVTCSCSCRKIQADMEGIKLDMVVMEKRNEESKRYNKEDGARADRSPKRNYITTGNFNYDQTIRELESKIVPLQKSSKKDLNDKEQIISSLEGRLTKAEHDYTILSKQLTDITQERDSLILAFSLIIDEKSGGQNIKPGKEFVRPKRSSKNVQSTSATTTNISQNCFSVLDDSIAENAIHVELELNEPDPDEASDSAFDNSVIVKSVKESSESRASKHDEIKIKGNERMLNRTNTGKNPTKKHRSVIIGDSIVKGLDQHKLSRSKRQNIGVRGFKGATIQDMRDDLRRIQTV